MIIEDKYYNNIKEYLLDNEISKTAKNYVVNRNDLKTYYNVGRELVEAGKHYGESVVKKYSIKLKEDLNIVYSYRSLNYMIKYYEFQKLQSLTANLSWGYWIELLPIKDVNIIKYYINQVEVRHLTTKQLRIIIKNKEYERLPNDTRDKLYFEDKIDVKDLIPNPILIKNKNNIENASEVLLHNLIMEDIELFMNELGNNFSFIGSEYKIKFNNKYNYIDILLFNFEFNCFVVVELKITELKKEHIGQIQVYMNYIDKNIKKVFHNNTVGIIICKKNNQYVIDYCSDERIISREYKLIK